jgi:hypothetical protein
MSNSTRFKFMALVGQAVALMWQAKALLGQAEDMLAEGRLLHEQLLFVVAAG